MVLCWHLNSFNKYDKSIVSLYYTIYNTIYKSDESFKNNFYGKSLLIKNYLILSSDIYFSKIYINQIKANKNLNKSKKLGQLKNEKKKNW